MKNVLLIIMFLAISHCFFGQNSSEKIMPIKITALEKAHIDSTSIGKLIPNFFLLDTALNKVDIANFKGVNVVIDIWATWCIPCLREAPYFEKLRNKYENDTLKFISVSIDNFSEEWLNFLIIKNIDKHNQYFVGYNETHPINWFTMGKGTEKGIEFVYTSIPRFIIIDKNQKIINRNTNLPSSGKLMNEIKNLNP